MKTRFLIALIVLVPVFTFAQQKETGVVKLRGTRLTYPLVNKWIEEFNNEYPAIRVTIALNAPADSLDFSIASYELSGDELKENRSAVIVTRYVQLPIVNSQRPGLAQLQATGFMEKDLQNLFFTPNTPTLLASSQAQTPIALYVRDRPVCAVKAFAGHYGNDPKELKGTGIKGDDQDLAEAVKKDVNGISFNNLGFIYNVKTRRVVDNLAIIPLDLNENGKIDKDEKIYGTLDEVVAYVERTKNPKFVNERVNFIFNKNSENKSAGIFLQWILTKGQKYNHDLGFINQQESALANQRNVASATFKFSKASCEGADELMKQRKSKKVNN